MAPSRLARVVVAFLLLIAIPSLAAAATTEFRVLFDADNDPTTGCTVNGMDGVDQVLVTQVTDDAGTARVTRTHRELCTGTVLGGAVDIVTTGWDAGFNNTSKLLTIETRIPFSAFGSAETMPSIIRAGFDASRNGSVHTSLANQDGTPIEIPEPPARRRAIGVGDERHITLDGALLDWGRIKPAVIGLASNGTPTVRLLRILAWPDTGDNHLYFAATAYLGSDFPYADDNTYLREPGQSLLIGAPGVLNNDAIPGGAPLTAEKVTDPARGTVTLNADGSFTYSPNHPQVLTDDEFEYKALGGGKESNVARVVIHVNQNENPNTPQNDQYTTPEDKKKIVPAAEGVLANDPHTDLLVASLFSPPSHGTVILNADGGFTYTPANNFFGTDTFVYTAAKKQGAPEGIGGNATVTITVTPVNDAPNLSPATFSIPENSPNNTPVGTVSASDIEGNNITYSIVGGNTGGAFTINSSSGQIRVANSAALDFETNPTFSLIVRASDGSANDEATITINLTDTNEPPVIVAGGTLNYTENDPPAVINGSLTVTDTDSPITGATVVISNNFAAGQDVLSFTPVGAITGIYSGNTLTLTGTDSDANYQLALRSVRYQNTSEDPSTAPRTITWTATDGTFTSTPVTSFINVLAVNDAPTITSPNNASVPENTTAVLTVTATDLEGETLTYSISGGADAALFTINATTGALSFISAPNFEAPADAGANNIYDVTVQVSDGTNNPTQNIAVTVTDVNEAPVFTSSATPSVPENTTAVVTVVAVDPEAVAVTYSITGGADAALFTINSTTGALSFIAPPNFEAPADAGANNVYNVVVTASDGPNNPTQNIAVTVTDVNEAPVFTSSATPSVPENTTAVVTVTTTDPEGNTITYSISGGADAALFTINSTTGALSFIAPPDFEAPGDAGANNVYNVIVTANDGTNAPTQNIAVTVTNVNDAPTDIALSNSTAPENQAPGTTIGTFSSTDQDAGDTFTYTLVSGTGSTDNASFQIVGNALQNAVNLDFEAQPSYSIRVRSTDAGGLFFEEVFTITLTNVNETPTDIALSNASVNENQPGGTPVGNFSTTDPDAGDTFTYTLVAGTGDTGNGAFQIVGNQLQTNAMFDFEAQNSYSIRIRSTDAGGLFFEEVFTISVNNVNEAPTDITLSANTVAENQPSGTAVGTFSTTDIDAGDTFTYTLVSGAGDTGNASFQIVGNQLQTAASFDFEAQNSYSIRVRSTDAGGLFFEESFTISVTDGNEAPTDISLSNASAPENQPVGTDIGTLTTTDPDAGDTFTYTLVTGTGDTDNASFQIAGDKLQNATNLDFEAQPTYSVRVRSTDAGGLFFEEVFTITITNVNETPVDMALSNATVAENQPSGTAVGTFSTTDPDAGDTFTYSLVVGTGDTGNGSFQIVGNQLQTAASFDLEAQGSYSIRVRTTDAGGLFYEEVFTITVTNVNEAPTDIALSNSSIAENQPAGTAVGTLSTTDVDAGDTFTYTLVTGAGDTGNGSFQIVGNQLQTAAPLNFEAQNSYSVRVRTTDAGGLFYEEVFTISVTNVNEAPTDIALSNATAPENQAIGTTIGNFSTTDPDAGDTFTYTLVVGTGDADNAKFQIVGNALQNAVNLDFDAQPSYSIRVRSTDAGGLFFEEVFTITLTNVNETPTDIALSNASVNENLPSGSAVGNFSTTDPDAGDTFTYTLVVGAGDTGNGSFQIVGNQLQTSASFNFEAQNSYSIRVRTTDAGGLFYEEVFTINVNNVNEAPTDIALSNATVPENQAVGTTIGTFSTTDVDAGDTHTYTLVAGAGSTDNAKFQIAGNALQNAVNLDFEAQSSYSIRVRTTDAGGLFYEEVFTITVTNANETPTDISLSNASTPENQPVGTDIGTLTTTDPDAGDTFTYTLVAGTGDTDNGSFQIVGDKLQNATNLNFEAQSTYSVRVRTTDAGGLFYEEVFTITVTDANDAPTALNLSNNSVAENQPSGTTVGTFSTTDQEGGQTHTYTLVVGTGDTDNASFQIVGNQLQTAASFNYEVQNSYSIRVRTTDNGVPSGFFEQVFTINVTNVNETPTDIALSNSSVAENQPSGTAVGTFSSTDPDTADTFTYSLVVGAGDTGNASFQIVGNQLQTAASFNYEAQNSYSIRVRTTDAGGLFYEEVFTINVTNVNETPTDIALSNASINENSGVNAVIGTFSTTDPDVGDTFTYTLVVGAGDTDNAFFNISGNQLRENASLNYELKSSYSIRVRTTDAGGLFYEEVFTITVIDVNEAPTAVTDTYNAVGGTLVHIAGSVTLPSPAPVATTGDVHTTPRTTGVKANDTDPDTNPSFNTLTVTFVGAVAVPLGGQATAATANGSVTMHSDGSFHYTPNAGYLGADSFTYTINDGANNAVGTVNFTVHAPAIRYVKNNAPVAGNGTSVSPHQTLAAAITASTAGELIYVMEGDGTATNYGGSNVMKANQKLWGQGVALSVTANSVALNLIAATNRPLIGPGGGANETIRLMNVAGIDIQGLRINGGTTNAIDLTTTGANAGGFSASNNIITAATLEGIDINHGSSGSATVDVHDNTITSTGTGFDFARTGTGTGNTIVFSNNTVTAGAAGLGINIAGGVATATTVTGFSTNSILGATGGTGVSISNATFDATPGGTFQTVTGGITNVGQSGNGVGGSGIVLTTVAGDLSFSTLNIYADNGSGLFASSGAAYTGSAGLQIVANTNNPVIQAVGGPAVDLNTVTIDLQPNTISSTNSATTGVSLAGVAGTFAAGAGSAIQNAGTTDFAISGGSVTSTYNGTIYDNAGQLISIANSTGGTKIFAGAIDDLDGTTDPIGGGAANNGGGISLTNNGGTTIRFNGGLDLSTGATAAFAATGGGTVEVCDENACNNAATGALVNKITTTTGVALNVANTTIGANNLEFRSIAANGAANGIILNTTGALGGLKVKGNAAAGTGGTIQSTTGVGILMTSTTSPAFNFMNIQSSGDDGIRGSAVSSMTLNTCNLTNNGNATAENGLQLGEASGVIVGITGTLTITNTNITGSAGNNVHIRNTSGSLTAMNITGGSFNDLNDVTGANSFLFEMSGTASTAAATISGGTQFHNNSPQRALEVQTHDSGVIVDFTVNGASFNNNGIHASFTQDTTSNLTFKMLSNNMQFADPLHAINVFSSSTSTGGSITGTIEGNTIGTAGSSSSGAKGNAIRIALQGRTQGSFKIHNNVIRQVWLAGAGARGMDLQFLGPVAAAQPITQSDILISNNDIDTMAPASSFPGEAIFMAADNQGSPARVRAQITGNNARNSVAGGSYGYPTFDGNGAQLVFIENLATAEGQLVDTGAASANALAELQTANPATTSTRIYQSGITLIPGPISTP